MGGPGKGALMDIIIGLIGALGGGFIMGSFDFKAGRPGPSIYTIIVAVIGAVVLTGSSGS